MNRLSIYDPFFEVFPELVKGSFPIMGRESLGIRVDVKETDGAYKVSAEIPGVKKEDIHVDIDGNVVSISAEVESKSEEKEGEKVLRSERYHGAASRSFTLATEVDESKAIAKYHDGVLDLTLPKKASTAAKRLAIS
jgi:HSP20 family protein